MSDATTQGIASQLEGLEASPLAVDYVLGFVKTQRAALARRIRASGAAPITEELAWRELSPFYGAVLRNWGAYLTRQGEGSRPALAALVKLIVGRSVSATRLGAFLSRASFLDAAFAEHLTLPLSALSQPLPGMPPAADDVAAAEGAPGIAGDVVPVKDIYPQEPTRLETIARHLDNLLGSAWTAWITGAVTALVWILDPTLAPRLCDADSIAFDGMAPRGADCRQDQARNDGCTYGNEGGIHGVHCVGAGPLVTIGGRVSVPG